jgi:arylsulfatase A-like enzyme
MYIHSIALSIISKWVALFTSGRACLPNEPSTDRRCWQHRPTLRKCILPVRFLLGLLLLQTVFLNAETSRPNIIFIMADDLGYGDLGCYGQSEIQTPHIDQLAQEGMRFTQCYAGSTVCAPTRCVLMTGLHTGHSRVRGNGGWEGPERKPVSVPLRDEDVTVAEILKTAGYATGVTGKWGLGQAGTSGIPNKQGFDEWLGFLDQRHAHGFYPEYIWRNETMVSLDGNLGGHKKEWIHDQFTDFSLEFIRDNKDNPFFLYVAYTIPHGRYEIASDVPYSNKLWPQDVKNYAAMVTRMDSDVGRIMALLQDLNIDEQTIVFFTSDNGAEIYYFRGANLIEEYETILKSPGPLRGWKRDLTDGGVRVPMIVRWPGKIEANTVSDKVWAFWDFLPTAAHLAALNPPKNIDGTSIVPTLLGDAHEEHEFLYWEFFERGFQQAVRYGDYKALRLKQNEPLELYRVTKDLKEMTNIASQHPQVIKHIESYLETARSPSPYWPK